MRSLPPNLRQVRDALQALTLGHRQTSVREIAQWIDAAHGRQPSTSTIWSSLEQLRQRGLAEKDARGKYRCSEEM